MTDPFDDPEIRAQLAKAGIVRKPGAAQQMLHELAPLLAAEGIDMDELDESTDVHSLNAALGRAIERRDLELFTPVGRHRTASLTVLARFSTAIAAGDASLARTVLGAIEREPHGDTPAISHVIGVSTGVLDAWHTDPQLRAALGTSRVPRWERSARAAATDILALARKGRAFDSLQGLHRRHSGSVIFEGAALAVAASVIARAKRDGVSVPELIDRALSDAGARYGQSPPHAAPPSAAGRQGASFRRPEQPAGRPVSSRADRAVVRDFGAWLRQQPTIDASTARAETQALGALFALARRAELEPQIADDVVELADLIIGFEDADSADVIEDALGTLDLYAHFWMETADEDLESWEEAHETLQAALAALSDEADVIAQAIDAAERLGPAQQGAALAQTRVITAVPALLEWLGAGRQASPTGGVRRADIQHVAGLLGVAAIGVDRRPAGEAAFAPLFDLETGKPTGNMVHAMAMRDVPVLAAWWEALIAAEVIETKASRVRPGPAAAQWSAGQPPLEAAETALGVFVAELLVHNRKRFHTYFEEPVIAATLEQLLRALDPEVTGAVDERDGARPELANLLTPRVLLNLRRLEDAGLLEIDDAGAPAVPVALGGAVARGVVLAMAFLAAPEEPA